MSSSSAVEHNGKLLSLLTAAGFTKKEIAKFQQDKMLTGTVESLTERELASKFGCTIDASVDDVSHVFLTTQRTIDPSAFQVGNMDDLADLQLKPNRWEVAKMYMSGAPELNLSPHEQIMFAKCKVADDVEETIREMLKARYENYLEMGLEGIDVYSRGKKNYEPGAELYVESVKAELVKEYDPVFYEYLKNYPESKPDNIEEEFSWVHFSIDDKPTFCLVHKFGRLEAHMYIFCERHFYVSRGHNSVQGVGGVFPLSDTKCAVVHASRTSTDQATGFGGIVKRHILANHMTYKIEKNLEQMRAKFKVNKMNPKIEDSDGKPVGW